MFDTLITKIKWLHMGASELWLTKIALGDFWPICLALGVISIILAFVLKNKLAKVVCGIVALFFFIPFVVLGKVVISIFLELPV